MHIVLCPCTVTVSMHLGYDLFYICRLDVHNIIFDTFIAYFLYLSFYFYCSIKCSLFRNHFI